MTQIKLDSQNKTIELELSLKGETDSLRIHVAKYQLTSDSGETFIEVDKVTTSREWINVFLSEYMDGSKRRFKVPAAVKVAL